MFTTFIAEENKDKLTQIYEKYYGTKLSIAKGILYDNVLAEEAVSDSIMTIIENLHKINDISCHKTRAYIVIITRSRAINLLNKQNRHSDKSLDDLELPDNNISVSDELTVKESCDRIIALIRTLPKSLSDVLYLSVVMDHSNTEIADLLSLSDDVVRKRLSRAKAQIKGKLIQDGFEYAEK